ncbi:MAG TPA: hypothetical protein VGR56_00270 [Nitrososphaerales archaeon]|nr:hypothetical protein [Nitrososphaerales archaeon]
MKYTDSSSLVSPRLSGVGPSYVFQDTKFSRDCAYALLTSQNNARGDLVMWTASSGIFANVTSGITNTANQIAFAPDDSYAYVTTTSGILLKQNYGATTATQITLTINRLRGIDFFNSSGPIPEFPLGAFLLVLPVLLVYVALKFRRESPVGIRRTTFSLLLPFTNVELLWKRPGRPRSSHP